MEQIRTQACFKALRTAGFQADAIVATGIIYQAIQSSVAASDVLHGGFTLFGFQQVLATISSQGKLRRSVSARNNFHVWRLAAENNNAQQLR